MRIFAHTDGNDFELRVTGERDRITVEAGGSKIEIVLDDQRGAIRTAKIGDRFLEFGWVRGDDSYRIQIEGVEYEVLLRDPRAEMAAKTAATPETGTAEVKAPIPGMIKKVLVAEGQPVRRDQPVLYLDAMKLENEIASPRDGTLKSVAVREGQAVDRGQLLFVVS